jgi:hypothetical protein
LAGGSSWAAAVLDQNKPAVAEIAIFRNSLFMDGLSVTVVPLGTPRAWGSCDPHAGLHLLRPCV